MDRGVGRTERCPQYTFTSNFNTQYGHSFSVVAQPPDSFCVLTREYALATMAATLPT